MKELHIQIRQWLSKPVKLKGKRQVPNIKVNIDLSSSQESMEIRYEQKKRKSDPESLTLEQLLTETTQEMVVNSPIAIVDSLLDDILDRISSEHLTETVQKWSSSSQMSDTPDDVSLDGPMDVSGLANLVMTSSQGDGSNQMPTFTLSPIEESREELHAMSDDEGNSPEKDNGRFRRRLFNDDN